MARNSKYDTISLVMTKKEIPSFLPDVKLPEEVMTVVKAVADAGGRALLVGGYVRDLVRGSFSKDIDIEVHRLVLDDLEEVLGRFGRVDLVGKQFGVLRLRGVDVDWSVPRRDSRGRHPRVEPDPFMGIEAAARRRDLTVNAMALDPLDGTLLDPFGGLEDLKKEILRAPDPDLFTEDPLRFFRVMSFAGYLEMDVDPSLTHLCAKMDLRDVAREQGIVVVCVIMAVRRATSCTGVTRSARNTVCPPCRRRSAWRNSSACRN